MTQLPMAVTRGGYRELGAHGVRALLAITGAAIDVAASANARRLRDVAMGKLEPMQ